MLSPRWRFGSANSLCPLALRTSRRRNRACTTRVVTISGVQGAGSLRDGRERNVEFDLWAETMLRRSTRADTRTSRKGDRVMQVTDTVIAAMLAAGLSGTAMAQSTPASTSLAGPIQSHWTASGFVGSNFRTTGDATGIADRRA